MEPGNNGNAIQKATEEGKGEVILSLLVSYNGEPFAGFARQPGQLTVQGSIERRWGWCSVALSKRYARDAPIRAFMRVVRW